MRHGVVLELVAYAVGLELECSAALLHPQKVGVGLADQESDEEEPDRHVERADEVNGRPAVLLPLEAQVHELRFAQDVQVGHAQDHRRAKVQRLCVDAVHVRLSAHVSARVVISGDVARVYQRDPYARPEVQCGEQHEYHPREVVDVSVIAQELHHPGHPEELGDLEVFDQLDGLSRRRARNQLEPQGERRALRWASATDDGLSERKHETYHLERQRPKQVDNEPRRHVVRRDFPGIHNDRAERAVSRSEVEHNVDG